MSAAERVAKGARLLDSARPGWIGKIDLELLDLSNGWHCVLGQVWCEGEPNDGTGEPYVYAVEDLGIFGDGGDYGFIIDNEYPESYDELDPLWRAEIRRRQGEVIA